MRDQLVIARHGGPLALLAADWARLVERDHPGAPFRSFPWLSTWWKTIAPQAEPHVLVAREGAEVVGLLPLYEERAALGGRRLRLMGDGLIGSDYLGVVARGDDEARLADAFAAHLAALDADELALDGVLDGDPLAGALAAHLPRVAAQPWLVCPRVATRGDFDDYLFALPDGAGAQWQRRRRWLARRPGHRIERLETPGAVERGLEILFALHHERWSVDGGSDAILGPRIERFHVEAGRALAELGWACVYVLSVDGGPRAALYGFRHGRRFAFYQAGHELEWRPRSVGTVLLGHVIGDCFAGGLEEFDFLRGDEPYKARWATSARVISRVHAVGGGLRPWLVGRGQAAWRALRAGARRALPPGAVAWVRARERAHRREGSGA
jgi:CelD/BcsL family acetyltransferase involved in cellulose biosynthesis